MSAIIDMIHVYTKPTMQTVGLWCAVVHFATFSKILLQNCSSLHSSYINIWNQSLENMKWCCKKIILSKTNQNLSFMFVF